MRRATAVIASVVLAGTVLSSAPAQAEPLVPKLPAGAPAVLQENIDLRLFGWDEQGPWVQGPGNMYCRIHLLAPKEWGWAFTTSPCWF